jgi:hypothetical protein
MGGKKATTTSKVTIPPEVLERYNAVNKRAETAAATPYEAFGKTASDYVAQLNAQQYAGFNDINATAGSYLPYMTQATEATQAGLGPAYEGIDNYMSPYIKNVADTTGAYLRQQQEQAQSGALGNAISSGAFGGDRAGIAAANLQQQNQMAYGKTMADIMNQGYTQALGASQADLARQLQGGSQLAQLGAQSQQLGLQGAQAKIAAGTMQQQTEQASKDAMINQFMQEKGYPFQTAQFLANIAMGTGAASGSTTTTQTPRNWLGFASGGAVEGYADGGGVAGPRTYTQSGIGGAGYVPAADLPVGQLMIADPPEQSQGKGTEEIIKMITMAMGAARGGAIDQRHGYALSGGVPSGLVMNPITRKLELRGRTSNDPMVVPVSAEAPAGGVGAGATTPAVTPPTTTSNGVIPRLRPDQQPNRGIPLLTQANYGMSEPEFKNYTSRKYNTPAEAAVGANDYYEMAGKGVGDAASIQHANRVYTAIQNGGEGLMPNELALYNHYKEKGWNDDTQIAGMIGRFNVEAGEGINPNARNTLGGGYGTYGIMQARGPRFERLAAAGGLSPADLEAMPVTHGLSSGVAGGDNLNTQISTMDAQDYTGGVKPYEDRNFLGKFFYNRDGSMNQNALLSVLMGVGKAAEAQTISPLGGILSGIGGGAEAYKGLQKQAADIGLTKAQTTTEALQFLKNSIYYDQNLGMSLIPLENGSVQNLADFMVNPAGPAMGGVAMDEVVRSIVGGAASRGVDLTTATPEEILSGATLPPDQGPVARPIPPAPEITTSPLPDAGLPIPQVVSPYESFGTFPIGDAEQAYIAQADTRSRMPMNQIERQAAIERAEASRAAADAGTASSSLAFRNTNELAATVAKAAAANDLGPLGGVISTYEGLASQLAGTFGIQYDGSAATSQALLNKLSSLSADQMTADTAAASLYLQNKNIFPDITSNATAAAEITAEMLTRNMLAYEKGQYINDLYRAQKGVVKDLTGADALFNKQAGNIYQGEKANIAELLKYAGDAEADAEVKQLVVDFFDSANKGAFKDQADAQAALEAIFTILPGQHNVSSGLGRYFVQ